MSQSISCSSLFLDDSDSNLRCMYLISDHISQRLVVHALFKSTSNIDELSRHSSEISLQLEPDLCACDFNILLNAVISVRAVAAVADEQITSFIH